MFRGDDPELQLLMQRLYDNDTDPAIYKAVSHHADSLGRSICYNFALLYSILDRHELLIRKRWNKKSSAQRRDVLLAAWPAMPREYRPNDYLSTMSYSE
jgi:hypothetical protein